MTTRSETCSADVASAFVEHFRAVWAAPTLESLDALTHPDVRFTQPLLRDVHGRQQANAYWRRVFMSVPDMHLDVINWAVSANNMVYIEFHIKGTLGRQPFAIPAVDRYELDSTGRVRHRILYCDPLLMAQAALRPRALVALLRAGARVAAAAASAAIRSSSQGRGR
jgi:limonene-1,2-epoxide hydrolase